MAACSSSSRRRSSRVAGRLWPLGGLVLASALVACGSDDKKSTSRASAARSAQVLFLDWEPNVLGDPERPVSRAKATAAAKGKGVVLADETPSRYWAVVSRPALTAADIDSAKQEFDPVTNQPVVALTLSGDGRGRLAALTRGVARRAKQTGTQQHFAIVVDEKVVSRPFVDPRTSPNGIDATNGIQIQGGFTVAQARDLADRIDGGG
jgi:SecD/SecF fusion protein